MNVLTANFKHLYQRPAMWVAYLVLGFVTFACVAKPLEHPEAGEGHFIGLVGAGFLFGLPIAAAAINVLVRPFSFCLPGHKSTVRKQLFISAIVINGLFSLLLLAYPDLDAMQTAVVMVSAFFAGLITFWLGVLLAFGTKNTGAFIGFALFAVFAGSALGLPKAGERVIVYWPHIVIPCSVLFSAVMWFRLGREALTRHHCCKDWVGLFDAFNPRKVMKQTRARRAEQFDKAIKDRGRLTEQMFLKKMTRAGVGSRGMYVWGDMYASFAPVLMMWRRSIPGIVILPLILGYIGQEAAWFMLTLMPMFMFMSLRLPMYCSMLTGGGRRDRYVSTMVSMIMIVAAGTVMIAGVAAVTWILSLVIPPFDVAGHTLIYRPLHPALTAMPVVLWPFAFIVAVLLAKRPSLITVVVMVMAQLVFVAVILTRTVWKKDPIILLNPYAITAVAVIGWLGLTATLQRVSRGWDLVWN